MSFDQKRDACVLFLRAQAQLGNEAADKLLVATSFEELESIINDSFDKVAQLTVEEFIYE